MLYAYSKDKELCRADTVSDRTDQFCCPGCREQVTWRNGLLRRPHFAHRSNASCSTFSEGETEEHLVAKGCLSDWYDPLPVEVESFLPDLNQRPDLKYHQLVIEIQCSPISLKDFTLRTKGYLKAGYQPWWILGRRLQPKTKNQWHGITKASCTYDTNGFHLWGIDTNRLCLIHYNEIYWHYQYGVGYHCTWFSEGGPIDPQSLQPILQDQMQCQNRRKVWQPNSYQYWILQQLIKKGPTIMKVQSLIYRLHGHIARLPYWCYQESRYGFLFEHWLLAIRFCFHIDPQQTLTEWLEKLSLIDWTWSYPLLDQSAILSDVFRECRYLVDLFEFQNQ